MRKEKRPSKFKLIVLTHISNNLKEYLTVAILFLIGVILGVIFINNMGEANQTEVSNYINQFLTVIKDNSTIDKVELMKNTIKDNIVLAVSLWFVGSTVIGIPIVYGIVAFRGFCLGYTISSLIATLGTGKGIMFALTSILFQNILFIPCVLALAVSGIKLYKSIMKDKRKENIKTEIIRHTLFSLFKMCIRDSI